MRRHTFAILQKQSDLAQRKHPLDQWLAACNLRSLCILLLLLLGMTPLSCRSLYRIYLPVSQYPDLCICKLRCILMLSLSQCQCVVDRLPKVQPDLLWMSCQQHSRRGQICHQSDAIVTCYCNTCESLILGLRQPSSEKFPMMNMPMIAGRAPVLRSKIDLKAYNGKLQNCDSTQSGTRPALPVISLGVQRCLDRFQKASARGHFRMPSLAKLAAVMQDLPRPK